MKEKVLDIKILGKIMILDLESIFSAFSLKNSKKLFHLYHLS